MLVSVSDDRTIRVWPLVEDSTGRIPNPCIIFGHTARVWDCQFVDEYLVSISEDLTCRVWKNGLLAGKDEENTSDVDCLACWEGHVGKNVWSCAISPEHKMVATGGQDSGIRLWSLVSIKKNKIESEDDLACIALPPQFTNDYVRNFVLAGDKKAVVATNNGHLLQFDASIEPGTWTSLHSDQDYRGYAMLQASDCGRLIVAGSMSGHLLMFSTDNSFEPVKVAVHQQKIFEMFIESSLNQNVFYIISHAYNGKVYMHRLNIGTREPVFETLYQLELPTERTTIVCTALTEQQGLLICGSRESALLIYRLPGLGNPCKNILPIIPLIQLRRTHGRQCVSSVVIKPKDSSDSSEDILFWTTGRDGGYIQYRLRNLLDKETIVNTEETQLGIASRGDTITETKDLVLEKVYRNRVTKGWLEGAIYLDGQLLLLGFYRKRFFVYNEQKNFEMMSVACGGAHRRWQFLTRDAKLNTATFAFIRKEVLYAYFRDGSSISGGFNESILLDNYHGRDVRAIRYMKLFPDSPAPEPLLFATGGEDTILRLQQYMPLSDVKFVTLATIRKHTSAIKSIEWSKGISTLLFTSGAHEELRCWKIEAKQVDPHNSTTPLSVHCLEWATCPFVSETSETRIMDITVVLVDATRGLHLVGAVYSDSMIRVWLFNETTRKFSLVVDGTWHAKCILQIEHIIVPDEQGRDRLLFFTSATDGRIACWDISESLYDALNQVDLEVDPTKPAIKLTEPAFYYSAHMSGVNALQVMTYRDSKHLLFITGGEDNAVAAAVVNTCPFEAVGKPSIIPNAHASSVTDLSVGVNLIGKTVFTVSTDQRLNRWEIVDHGKDGVSLDMVDAIYVDVPDPSAMDLVEYNGQVHIAVTGIGLESVKTTI
ncbi:WD40-repeat-containing domain protein [Phycomyces nitens]|nr:WD40-repeat-containing domain protein [Phycomyces nitens]